MAQERCPTCHREIKKSRSVNQNDLYWGYFVEPLTEHLSKHGYTTDDVHELLKLECNGKILVVPADNGIMVEVRIGQSTTGLTVKEFGQFLDRVKEYASKRGCVLRMPDDPND